MRVERAGMMSRACPPALPSVHTGVVISHWGAARLDLVLYRAGRVTICAMSAHRIIARRHVTPPGRGALAF